MADSNHPDAGKIAWLSDGSSFSIMPDGTWLRNSSGVIKEDKPNVVGLNEIVDIKKAPIPIQAAWQEYAQHQNAMKEANTNAFTGSLPGNPADYGVMPVALITPTQTQAAEVEVSTGQSSGGRRSKN